MLRGGKSGLLGALVPVEACVAQVGGRGVQERLVVEASDFAVTRGLMVAPRENAGSHGRARRYAVAPCSLVPTAFPRAAFELGKASQRAWLQLLDAVARDRKFLTSALAATCTVDAFTARLMEVYDAAFAADPKEYTEGTVFAIVRNDYMLHQPEGRDFEDCGLRHVEANTIAASLGALSTTLSEMHRYLLSTVLRVPTDILDAHMPSIHVTSALADGFKAAYDHYTSAHPPTGQRPVVLAMIVQPNEFNAFDQRHVEYDLLQRHGVRTVRISLMDVHRHARREDGTNRLIIRLHSGGGDSDGSDPEKQRKGEQAGDDDGSAVEEVEAAVVYFRAGYTPKDYGGEDEWAARRELELSAAIKCPNIALHLAGTKKVQQVLAQEGVLERYLGDGEDARALRKTFAALYSLDPADYAAHGDGNGDGSGGGEAAVEAVIASIQQSPRLYVLKPQREGGGGNFYGQDAADRLTRMPPRERLAYIVQGRILPPTQRALVLADDAVGRLQESTTELGLFGVSVRRGTSGRSSGGGNADAQEPRDHVVENAGVLVRTKPVDSDEVGFAAGFGVLDTPWLLG